MRADDPEFRDDGVPLKPFTVRFSNGRTALGVRAEADRSPWQVVDSLHLQRPKRSITVFGGAGMMSPATMVAIKSFVDEGLAHFAHAYDVAIIDGGTHTGIMAMIGRARSAHHLEFPLIGVLPEVLGHIPGHVRQQEQADLDPFHTHFVFTGGERFGDESNMMAGIGWALGGQRPARALSVIINGGEIVKREAHARAVGPWQMPLLVLQGSGRTADALAGARAGSEDVLLADTLEQGTVSFVSVDDGVDALWAYLETFFSF
jgi:hypothetical protein